MALLATPPALADGRSDWRGYDWRSTEFGSCTDIDPAAGCHAHHAKWDWKRNQWVDVFYRGLDQSSLSVGLRLTNNDRKDDDYVCVTVLFLDANGRNLAAYHANIHIDPSSTESDETTMRLRPELIARIAKVDVGSKQCREGAGQDADVFARVRAALPQS